MPLPVGRRPDLSVARRYLEGYVEPDSQAPARPTWLPLYAWPTAFLLLLLAIVSWATFPYAALENGLPSQIAFIEGYHDVMKYLMMRTILLALFSVGLIALNLAVLLFDRARPLQMRLVDASSIIIPLLVILSLFFSPIPLSVQFNP